jgi:hypothetical protein
VFTWRVPYGLGASSELHLMTRPLAGPVKLTSGRRSCRLHQYPAFGGDSSGGRDQSSIRAFLSQMVVRSARLDPARLIGPRG